VLGAGHANRQGQTDLLSDPSAEGSRDVRRRSEEVDGTCHVKEGLVDRHPLDARGEVMEYRHHLVAEFLVAAEVTSDEEKVAAQLARPPARHPGPDAIGPGLVGGRQHHAAAHGDGPFPQGRVQELLDGRVEGVQVGVKDRRPARSRHHAPETSRTYVRFPVGDSHRRYGPGSPALCSVTGHADVPTPNPSGNSTIPRRSGITLGTPLPWPHAGFEQKNRGGEAMSGEISGKFGQVLRGRNLIILAVTDVVLFLIANVAYGGGNQHGLRNNVSNVAWAVFLVGFFVLVVLGIVSIARAMLRRSKAHA
jgi:hypothetical protein